MKKSIFNISKERLVILLIFLGVLLYSNIRCYEIIDGELFVDVLIGEFDNLSFSSEGMISIAEQDSPIEYYIESQISFKIEDYLEENIYFLQTDKKDNIKPDFNFEILEKNVLEFDKKLFYSTKKIYVLQNSFSDISSAETYLNKHHLDGFDIIMKNQIECTVDIIDQDQKSIFVQTPFIIKSPGYLNLNEKANFAGVIIIESRDNKLVLINRLPLELYLSGVVEKEIGSYSPPEALKAQAVASRTYALNRIIQNQNSLYDLKSSVLSQVFRGELKFNSKISDSIEATKNEVLIYNDKLAETFFSSCCGGKTESNENIWKGQVKNYLRSKTDSDKNFLKNLDYHPNAVKWIKSNQNVFCKPLTNDSKWKKEKFHWTRKVSKKQIENNSGIKNLRSVKILKRGDSGRIIKVKLIGKSENLIIDSEYKIRKIFENLPSSLFYIKHTNPYVLEGKGYGHGVGMCQFGAINQAKKGRSYKEILSFYYTDTDLIKYNAREAVK